MEFSWYPYWYSATLWWYRYRDWREICRVTNKNYSFQSSTFLRYNLQHGTWIQHDAIGPLYVTSSYSTWIFCRGVSGFSTDCPCDVWCHGISTCLLHVSSPFENRNTRWAVGLTYCIVYIHFVVFWHLQLYMSWYIISFVALSILPKYSLFFQVLLY